MFPISITTVSSEEGLWTGNTGNIEESACITVASIPLFKPGVFLIPRALERTILAAYKCTRKFSIDGLYGLSARVWAISPGKADSVVLDGCACIQGILGLVAAAVAVAVTVAWAPVAVAETVTISPLPVTLTVTELLSSSLNEVCWESWNDSPCPK